MYPLLPHWIEICFPFSLFRLILNQGQNIKSCSQNKTWAWKVTGRKRKKMQMESLKFFFQQFVLLCRLNTRWYYSSNQKSYAHIRTITADNQIRVQSDVGAAEWSNEGTWRDNRSKTNFLSNADDKQVGGHCYGYRVSTLDQLKMPFVFCFVSLSQTYSILFFSSTLFNQNCLVVLYGSSFWIYLKQALNTNL